MRYSGPDEEGYYKVLTGKGVQFLLFNIAALAAIVWIYQRMLGPLTRGDIVLIYILYGILTLVFVIDNNKTMRKKQIGPKNLEHFDRMTLSIIPLHLLLWPLGILMHSLSLETAGGSGY